MFEREQGEVYGRIRGRQGKGEMMKLHYHLKNKNRKD